MNSLGKKLTTFTLLLSLVLVGVGLRPEPAQAQLSFFNFQDISGLLGGISDLGDIEGISDLLQGLDQFGGIGGIENIPGIDSILGRIGGINGIGDTAGISQLLGGLGDLGDLGSITDLLGGLGDLGDLGSITDLFGGISGLEGISDFGSIEDIVGNLGDIPGIDGILGGIGGIDGVGDTAGITNLLTGVSGIDGVDNLFGGFGGFSGTGLGAGDKSLEERLAQFQKKCEQNDQDLNSFFDDLGLGDLVDSLGLEGLGFDQILENFNLEDIMGGVLGGSIGDMLGDLLGGGGIGDLLGGIGGIGAVPVSDDTTHQNTATSNKNEDRDFEEQNEHKYLLSESCLRLNMIIGRLQTLNELEYIHKPNNLKSGFAELAGRQAELQKTLAQGYRAPESSTGVKGENVEPLYTPNWGQRIWDAVSNAFGSSVDTVKGLGDQAPLAQQAADALAAEQARSQNIANELGPSEEWQERGPAFEAGTSDDPARDLVTLLDPWSSNAWTTAFTNTNKFIDQEINDAEQNRREELIAGQGMLGITVCREWSADGKYCKYEQTIVDPAMIRTMAQAYNQAWSNAMTSGVFNSELYAAELARINTRLGGEKAPSIMEESDPCPSDGSPCPDTGWDQAAAAPREDYYPGQEALADNGAGSDWWTKFSDSISDSFSGFFDSQLNNFLREGEDAFTHLTDFEDFTRGLNRGGRPSEFERISSAAAFANRYVDEHQGSFADNADLNELIEIIFNYILGLMETALTQ